MCCYHSILSHFLPSLRWQEDVGNACILLVTEKGSCHLKGSICSKCPLFTLKVERAIAPFNHTLIRKRSCNWPSILHQVLQHVEGRAPASCIVLKECFAWLTNIRNEQSDILMCMKEKVKFPGWLCCTKKLSYYTMETRLAVPKLTGCSNRPSLKLVCSNTHSLWYAHACKIKYSSKCAKSNQRKSKLIILNLNNKFVIVNHLKFGVTEQKLAKGWLRAFAHFFVWPGAWSVLEFVAQFLICIVVWRVETTAVKVHVK